MGLSYKGHESGNAGYRLAEISVCVGSGRNGRDDGLMWLGHWNGHVWSRVSLYMYAPVSGH